MIADFVEILQFYDSFSLIKEYKNGLHCYYVTLNALYLYF
jgi:hypothetical protein